jgi:hypothetical protein
MSATTANLFIKEEREPGGFRWTPVLAALAIGGLLGAGAMDLSDSVAARISASREPTAVVKEWPARPLPREWRWSPPTVKYEHMYSRANR